MACEPIPGLGATKICAAAWEPQGLAAPGVESGNMIVCPYAPAGGGAACAMNGDFGCGAGLMLLVLLYVDRGCGGNGKAPCIPCAPCVEDATGSCEIPWSMSAGYAPPRKPQAEVMQFGPTCV